MTGPSFAESRIDLPPGRGEEDGLRPRLTARKEAPPRTAPGFKPQSPNVALLSAAHYFAGSANVPSVRAESCKRSLTGLSTLRGTSTLVDPAQRTNSSMAVALAAPGFISGL